MKDALQQIGIRRVDPVHSLARTRKLAHQGKTTRRKKEHERAYEDFIASFRFKNQRPISFKRRQAQKIQHLAAHTAKLLFILVLNKRC